MKAVIGPFGAQRVISGQATNGSPSIKDPGASGPIDQVNTRCSHAEVVQQNDSHNNAQLFIKSPVKDFVKRVRMATFTADK